MFESTEKLLLGLLCGIAFGFLLQKGQVAKYPVLMAQFFLKDWRVFKIMFTAVVVGAIGIYGMYESGRVQLQIKPAAFGGVITGAILFGIGLSVFGLCPGTSVAACGEGHRDALVGVFGMLVGAGAYVLGYEQLQPLIKGFGDLGEVTLPQMTHTSPWLWILPLALLAVLSFVWVKRHSGHQRHAVTDNPA